MSLLYILEAKREIECSFRTKAKVHLCQLFQAFLFSFMKWARLECFLGLSLLLSHNNSVSLQTSAAVTMKPLCETEYSPAENSHFAWFSSVLFYAAFLGSCGNYFWLQIQAWQPQSFSNSFIWRHHKGLGYKHVDCGVHFAGERRGYLFPFMGSR